MNPFRKLRRHRPAVTQARLGFVPLETRDCPAFAPLTPVLSGNNTLDRGSLRIADFTGNGGIIDDILYAKANGTTNSYSLLSRNTPNDSFVVYDNVLVSNQANVIVPVQVDVPVGTFNNPVELLEYDNATTIRIHRFDVFSGTFKQVGTVTLDAPHPGEFVSLDANTDGGYRDLAFNDGAIYLNQQDGTFKNAGMAPFAEAFGPMVVVGPATGELAGINSQGLSVVVPDTQNQMWNVISGPIADDVALASFTIGSFGDVAGMDSLPSAVVLSQETDLAKLNYRYYRGNGAAFFEYKFALDSTLKFAAQQGDIPLSGDLDNDGRDELILQSTQGNGNIRVFAGTAGGLGITPTSTLAINRPGETFGRAILHDTDLDFADDLVLLSNNNLYISANTDIESTTILTLSDTDVEAGAEIVADVGVIGGSGDPQGLVSIKAYPENDPTGVFTLVSGNLNSLGQLQLKIAIAGTGHYFVFAEYAGNGPLPGSKSAPQLVIVTGPQVDIPAAPDFRTTVLLEVENATVGDGQPVKFNVRVLSPAGTPQGEVKVRQIVGGSNGAVVGTAPFLTLVNGTTTTTEHLGYVAGTTPAFFAEFIPETGSPFLASKTADNLHLAVVPLKATTTELISVTPSTLFTNEMLETKVKVTSGSGVPNGLVNVFTGARLLGQGNLDAQGFVTIRQPVTLGPGSYPIIAQYVGGGTYSSSRILDGPDVIIKESPTPVLSPTLLEISSSGAFSITAKLTPTATNGNINFSIGSTTITKPVTGGSATLTQADLPAGALVNGNNTITAAYSNGSVIANARVPSRIFVTGIPVSTALDSGRTIEYFAQSGGLLRSPSSMTAQAGFTTTPNANIGILVKSTNPALPPTNVRVRFNDGRVVTVPRMVNLGEPPNPLATEFTYLFTIPSDAVNGDAQVTVEGIDLEGRPFLPLTDRFSVASNVTPTIEQFAEINFEAVNGSQGELDAGNPVSMVGGDTAVVGIRMDNFADTYTNSAWRIYPIGGLPSGMKLFNTNPLSAVPVTNVVGIVGTATNPQMNLVFASAPTDAGQSYTVTFAATSQSTGFTVVRTLRFTVGGENTLYPPTLDTSVLSLPILDGNTPATAILEINTRGLALSQSKLNPVLLTVSSENPAVINETALSSKNSVSIGENRYTVAVRSMSNTPHTETYTFEITDPMTGRRIRSNARQIYWGGPSAAVNVVSQALQAATQKTLSQLEFQNTIQQTVVQLYADPLRFPATGQSFFLPNGQRGIVFPVNGVPTLVDPTTQAPIVGVGAGAGIVAVGAGGTFIQIGAGGSIVAAGAGIVAAGAGNSAGNIVGVGAGAGIVGVGAGAGIVGVGAGAGIVAAGAGIVAAGAGGIVAAGAGFTVIGLNGQTLIQGSQNGGAIISPGAGGNFNTSLANLANLASQAQAFPPPASIVAAGAGIVAAGAGIVAAGAGLGVQPTNIVAAGAGNIVAAGAGIVADGAGLLRPERAEIAMHSLDPRTDAAKAYDALLFSQFHMWHALQMSQAGIDIPTLQTRLQPAAAAMDAANELVDGDTTPLTLSQQDAIDLSGTVGKLAITSLHPSGLITPGSRIVIRPLAGQLFNVSTLTVPVADRAWITLGGAMLTIGGSYMPEALPGLGIVPIQLNGNTLPIVSTSPTEIVCEIPMLQQQEIPQLVTMTLEDGSLAMGSVRVTPAQGAIEFDQGTMAVDETAGLLTVTLKRTGDSRGVLAMNLHTIDGTANDTVHYGNVGGFIVFDDGDTAPKTFTIPIINDKLSGNGDRTFFIALDGAMTNTQQNAAATVTIADTKLPRALIGWGEYAVGSDAGRVSTATLFNANRTVRRSITPFGTAFTGGVRVTSGDFNRDGIADMVVASGPSRASEVVVLDGDTGGELFRLLPFGAAFTRGAVISAGDLTGDGQAELVITAERGGGARIRVFTSDIGRVTNGGFRQIADFFGLIGGDGVADTKFRGGGRATVGDINGDGTGDLIFAAGAGGGPRIAIFDGTDLTRKLRGDFFAFEPKLRDGTYVAAGDFDGDGFAELVAGAGPGGGPRVSLFSGAQLTVGIEMKLKDFFAGDITNRGGIRVAVKNLDGDNRADLLVGAGPGGGSSATSYLDDSLDQFLWSEDVVPGFKGGIYVG